MVLSSQAYKLNCNANRMNFVPGPCGLVSGFKSGPTICAAAVTVGATNLLRCRSRSNSCCGVPAIFSRVVFPSGPLFSQTAVARICVPPLYMFPRTHIPSHTHTDMCSPAHISPTAPHTPNKAAKYTLRRASKN